MEKDAYTNQELSLKVGGGHTLYVQDWGNLSARHTAIFLHGGPGSQAKDKHKLSFDPARDRVIFFDQRGCGKSTPYGSLKNNTTQDLISDISVIADALKLEKFVLHGSSWGSTLALAYALEHPGRTEALVIGGVFTGSKREAQWQASGEFRTFYPEVWEVYLARTPAAHRKNPSAHHFEKALTGSPAEQKASAYAYDCLEGGIVQLDDRFTPETYETYDPAGMRIEIYYMQNGCFMPDEHILNNAGKLTMPVYIVQGRYDMVCPPETAYRLHRALPRSELYWTIGGHKHEHETQSVFSSIFARLNA